jgi:anti-anti-sigma factor
MTKYKCFEVQQHVDVTVVHLLDQKMLDRFMINEMRDELVALADQQKPQKVVINFAGVSRLSSEVLGALITCWKHVAENGGRLRLAGMSDGIREVFRITRLESRIFEVFPSVNEALVGF